MARLRRYTKNVENEAISVSQDTGVTGDCTIDTYSIYRAVVLVGLQDGVVCPLIDGSWMSAGRHCVVPGTVQYSKGSLP